ncbi:ABC transporter permease (plasmid) [Bosea vestrisii]|uniref:ABC transporter permease n=1 Tax=Bosea vestrisii TaxID=151416 RepID=UPI0024DF6D5E|nr:ABC transporter permease [Bosea vestrisii]WID99810.1 ABC transporter permease [Bosea vestrisii]
MSGNSVAARPIPSGPETAAGKRMKRLSANSDILATIVVVAVMVAAMQVASGYVPDYIMPSPMSILTAAHDIVFSDRMHVLVTIARLFAALGFALVVGVIIGVLMAMLPTVRPFLRAIIVIDTGIPALSWMLIAVFWFKDTETRIFFILTVILLPFYAMNVYEGIRSLPREQIDMVESFRPNRWQILRYLIMPHVVPYIFITTKSVVGYAIRMAVFAELVASAIGIGSRMSLAQSSMRIDLVFAWTFLLVIFNLVLQSVVSALEKLVLRWRPEVEVR